MKIVDTKTKGRMLYNTDITTNQIRRIINYKLQKSYITRQELTPASTNPKIPFASNTPSIAESLHDY